MIKHSVELIRWIRGIGSVKANVLPAHLELDPGVKMVADLSKGPGDPLGVGMWWIGTVSEIAVAGQAHVVMFNAPSGGAVIDGVMWDAQNTETAIEWNNWPSAAGGTLGLSNNIGGRQFEDSAQIDPQTEIPFGTVRIESLTQVAPPGPAVNRRGVSFCTNSIVQPLNIYIPPGDSYGFRSLTLNTNVFGTFWGRMFPLTGTSRAK